MNDLLEDMEQLFKYLLSNSSNVSKQLELIKNKKEIIKKILEIEQKYDLLIQELSDENKI